MPTIQYPKHPNVETAFVEQDDGTKNRVVLTAPQDISTIEYSKNPNSTKAYVTVNGEKHRVVLTADISGAGGGSDPHNLGWFADLTALQTAYPTADDGDYAILGSTDTVWVWDSDTTAWVDTDTKGQVTSVNNKTGAVTVQETLVSGTNIKTINGQDILGSGDLELSTYLPYPAGWTTTGTTFSFCDDIANDNTAIVGKAYLGEVTLNDLPANMGNAEIVVEIMAGTNANDKVIVLTSTSGNTAPYMWKYTYWNNGADVSGWIGFEQNFRFDALPTPSSDWLDKVVQYTGADNGTLVNGYFYVCTFDGANYGWTQKNVQPGAAQSDWSEQDPNSPAYIQNKPTDLSDFTNNKGFATMKNATAQLDMNNWGGNVQTVNVPGVDPTQTIIVSPNPANASDYATAGIVCTNALPDTLEFTCTNVPNVNIDVEVVILA